MAKEIELLKAGPERRITDWSTQVYEMHGGRCSNCGAADNVRVRMIVPPESGGLRVLSNGVLLCRTCELARTIDLRIPQPASGERTRPINFLVSQKLHTKLRNGLAKDYGFRSVSALVRFLMTRYVSEMEDFRDLALYQDNGSDVKINVWVGRELYDSFKACADREGSTVTDTLKSLILMYEVEARQIMKRREP